MADLAEKLYPPTIGSSIPAFYADNGTAKIVVPFSMNKAVDNNQVSGFSLKIKTVQSNRVVKTLEMNNENTVYECIMNKEAVFYWSGIVEDSSIKPGQHFKFQLAYKNIDGMPGYFSTVAIGKYTAKPNVYIKGANNINLNDILPFQVTYVGVYEPGIEDKSERPYSYIFNLYNQIGELVETSNWLLHNSSINTEYDEAKYLETCIDTYSFKTSVMENKEYRIEYKVKTINDLIISTPPISCMEISDTTVANFPFSLKAENIFEDGYINLSLLPEDENLSEDDQISVSIEICRAEKFDNYSSWKILRRVYFSSYNSVSKWSFKDFTVEQGVYYKYCYRLYNNQNLYTSRKYSNIVYSDFEDMFLFDGLKQLKIRFNPKISSFKATRLESKTDTIGSRYPFIFRNGIVNYKEFPIAGLISYLMDNNELFVDYQKDLNVISDKNSRRKSTPINQELNDVSITGDLIPDGKSWELSATSSSLDYNMRVERIFKLKLLDWLNDGKIKLFRSPAEGNYLIRLMNISLTPEDKVGRMIHNFSATAYEMEELTYENLLSSKFINLAESTTEIREISSKMIKDIILKNWDENNLSSSIKLNEYNIINFLKIEQSPAFTSNNFTLRIGTNSAANKVLCTTNEFLLTAASGVALTDVWFNPEDNNVTTKEEAISKVGDASLTYEYIRIAVQTGKLEEIKDIKIRNVIHTYLGPENIDNVINYGDTTDYVLQYFYFKVNRKNDENIYYKNGAWRLTNDDNGEIISKFSCLTVYHYNNQYFISKNGTNLIQIEDDYNNIFKLILDGDIFDLKDNPYTVNIDLTGQAYTQINIGAGIYITCGQQLKVVYNEE